MEFGFVWFGWGVMAVMAGWGVAVHVRTGWPPLAPRERFLWGVGGLLGVTVMLAGELSSPDLALYTWGMWGACAFLVSSLRLAPPKLAARAWDGVWLGLAFVHLAVLWLQQAGVSMHFGMWYWLDRGWGSWGMLKQRNLEGLWLVLLQVPMVLRLARAPCMSAREWLHGLMASALLAGLVATGSRTSMVLGAIVWGLGALRASHPRRYGWRVVGCWLLALFWLLWMPKGEVTTSSTLARFHASSLGAGAKTRLLLWLAGWEVFREHVLTGIGPGQWIAQALHGQILALERWPEGADRAMKFAGGGMWLHNWILQLIVEWGAIAGGMMVALLLGLVGKAWKVLRGNDRDDAWVAGVWILVMLAHGLSTISLAQPFVLAWLAVATSVLLPRRDVLHASRSEASALLVGCLVVAALLVPAQSKAWQQWLLEQQALVRPVRSMAGDFARSVQDPWIARAALYVMFVKLWQEERRARVWQDLWPYAWHYAQLYPHQGSWKIMILIAHLRDDLIAERRWIRQYARAFPSDPLSGRLLHHAQVGHARGEALSF